MFVGSKHSVKRWLAALVLATIPTTSFGWIATNGLIVEKSPGGFAVPYRGLSGPRDFWCAAGDYVIRELNLPADTLIFRTSSPPRRAGEGITFSLSAENAKKPGLLLLSGSRGITAAYARDFCQQLTIESD